MNNSIKDQREMVQTAIEEETMSMVSAHAEFVPVTFTTDRDAAQDVVALLEQHNVPALLDEDASNETHIPGLSRGVAVLVPEQMHDVATALMARDDDDDEDGFDDSDDEEFDDDDDDFDDLDDLDDDYDDDDDDDFDDDLGDDDID